MSSPSTFQRLSTGVSVSNLVLEQDTSEFFPEYYYEVNGKAIDAVSLLDVTPAPERKKLHVYSGVNSFPFDPQGKKIIAFDVIPNTSQGLTYPDKSQSEVLLYQKSASGQLLRLTPISEKVLQGYGMVAAKILNHPDHRLGEYSDHELMHFFAVAETIGPAFEFKRFESSLADENFVGEMDREGKPYSLMALGEYKDRLTGKRRQGFVDSPDAQGMGGMPPMSQPPMPQQPVQQPVTPQQPPMSQTNPMGMSQQPIQQPVQQPITPQQPPFDPAAFKNEAKYITIDPTTMMIDQWKVMFDVPTGEILGTVSIDANGNIVNPVKEIKGYQKAFFDFVGMRVPADMVIVN